MLDVKYIAEHPDAVKKNAADKNARVQIDQVLALNEQKKKLQLSVEEARTKINIISKDIATLKKADPKTDVSVKQAESRAIAGIWVLASTTRTAFLTAQNSRPSCAIFQMASMSALELQF